VRASPDGYTLLLAVTANTVNATLYDKLSFNFIRDIAPVASIVTTTYVMVVNPSVPAKTVAEFIAYASANPGKINMASTGNGSGTHVFGELFKMMTGVNMVHVPYRANFYPDLLGGQVQAAFVTTVSSIAYIRAGKLRALAVTTATRSPKNTPVEIIDKINKEINLALADPKMKAQFADLGVEPMPMTPAAFGKFIADETEKWGKVIRAANIKAG
jgi:tripartite-type tricarboxylate transporter receptor subunit TctC